MNYQCTQCEWTGEEKECGTYIPTAPILPSPYKVCPLCLSEVTKPNYTRVPPTEPGYYWYKDIYTNEVVEVRDDGETLGVYSCGWDVPSTLSKCGGEWSERIEPPE